MNKRGTHQVSITSAFVVAIMLLVVFLIILPSGGLSTLVSIGKAMKQIPGFVWVVVGIIFLFWRVGGRRR